MLQLAQMPRVFGDPGSNLGDVSNLHADKPKIGPIFKLSSLTNAINVLQACIYKSVKKAYF